MMVLAAILAQDVLPPGPVDQEWVIRALAGALIAVVVYVARREEKRGDALATDNRELIVTVTKLTTVVDDGFDGLHRRLDSLDRQAPRTGRRDA